MDRSKYIYTNSYIYMQYTGKYAHPENRVIYRYHPLHSNMKTMIIYRLWSNCLHDQLSLPNQRAFSNFLYSIHFLGEIATVRENIPQLSCLLGQLCQV